jgi:putative DNA primase/helicase
MEIIETTQTSSLPVSNASITSLCHKATLEAVLRYHNQGWAVTPIKDRSKRPFLTGWQTKKLTRPEVLEQFSGPPRNVGIVLGELSDGIVDLDLDRREAVSLAPHFLPKTNCMFGRPSNPRSHYLYRVSNPGARTPFEGAGNDGMLLEYRANGCVTVFPPSVHESGESIDFDRKGEPAHVDREELLSAASRLAAATLLACQWIEGQRHELALALGGVFARSGWLLEQAQGFVQAICEATADEEATSRLRDVSDAYDRVAGVENAYGFPKLAELIGSDRVKKLSEWLRLRTVDSSQPVSTAAPGGTNTAKTLVSNKFAFTDSGLADRFARQHQGGVRYCHQYKAWYVWNDRFWEKDEAKKVVKLAQDSLYALANDASKCETMEDAKRLLDGVRRSLDANRLRGLLSIAESELPVHPNDFDANPYLLNCRNGTVDLRNGKLKPYSASDLNTKCLPVNYVPEAICPTFLNFLERIANGNQELIGFLQRAMGYALTGSAREQCYFILHGNGANGKSTLINLFKWIIGPYAAQAQADTFMARKSESIRTDIARLAGHRMVVSSENDVDQREPPRVCRRLFVLSHATIASSSICA